MTNLIAHFRTDESGATAIEYSLIASLISVLILGGVTTLGTSLLDLYTALAEALGTAL